MRVELLALDLERVSRWAGDEHVRAERLPQRDDAFWSDAVAVFGGSSP